MPSTERPVNKPIDFDFEWKLPWLVAMGYGSDDLIWLLERLFATDRFYN